MREVFIVGSVKEGRDQVIKFFECHGNKFVCLLVIEITAWDFSANVKCDQIILVLYFFLTWGN